ncbi:SAC3 family protein A-like isoform X1 [Papaver somniferum]|uniref:SAC3 family protein A-like isoform X1 n=1 Tax=Papaver somniferum TaxID=3469 RepID=UPI000E6FC8D0|nr:SAC3 family protein A-like isoform X1 [Papaver somniferum]XP_026414832.1 SAC3 family protein A-like isoform X1 [Papaver somniferum]XP_026414833.1 SAC3 family protein A-like isoform X1 [Papaver somniferum]
MSSTSTGTSGSGGDEIAKRIKFMELNCVPKLEILVEKIQNRLHQEVDTSGYLPQCQKDITRLLSSLRIPEFKYSKYDDKKVWNLEERCRNYLENPVLSAALTAKRQVADVNQGRSSVYLSSMLPLPTPITGSQSAPWAMHRTNSSVHNAVYMDTVYYPYQKTDPPPRNAQYGLNTSSYAADSSIVGVPTGTQDYSGYASYSTYDDPYGYGTIGYQDNCQQGNQPYTPQLGGFQNSGSPYQPLTSSQNSGSYAGSASYSSVYHDTGDYQTSGGLVSTAYSSQLTQADVWNDGSSYADYPSPHYSEYTPAHSSNAQSSSNLAVTADNYSQTSSVVTCAPGTENKSTTRAATRDSRTTNRHILNHLVTPFVLPDVLGVLPTQLPGTTSWKFMPTPSNRTNTTSWRPGPTASSTPSWTRPELTASSATPWTPEPTSTSRMSRRPEPISSGLPTVQQVSQVTGGTYGGYQRQGPAAFQNYGVSRTPSLLQMPLDLNPVPCEVSHGIQQTAFSQGPTSCFPATHPGARTYASGLQSGSSMDTRRADELQITTNASILPPFLVDDQVEQEEALSEHDQVCGKIPEFPDISYPVE